MTSTFLIAGVAGAGRLAAFAERPASRRHQRRREPEQDRREQREDDGKEHDGAIDFGFGEERQRRSGERDEDASCDRRQQQPKPAAERRQQHALGDELPHETPAAGAERAPNRHLPRATGGAAELKVRDVHADDQEHGADRREEDEKRRPRVERERVVQALEPHAHLRVRVGIRLLELRRDRRHVGLRAIERHARLEPARRRASQCGRRALVNTSGL